MGIQADLVSYLSFTIASAGHKKMSRPHSQPAQGSPLLV